MVKKEKPRLAAEFEISIHIDGHMYKQKIKTVINPMPEQLVARDLSIYDVINMTVELASEMQAIA